MTKNFIHETIVILFLISYTSHPAGQPEAEALIVNGQQPPEMTSRPEWYAAKMRGFTQDGQLMVFVLTHELGKLTPEDKALISNPEILENMDPDIDMFVFLVQLKNN